MKTYNNIYVCSDFLYTHEKEQASNRKWLMDILFRPILLATGKKVKSFFSSMNDTTKLSRKKFFDLSGIQFTYSELQFFYNDNLINEKSIEYLKLFISENDLVIGYELSEQTRRILDKIKITYIDIWLHPIRFLDDILFGFNSNNKNIYKEISQFNVSEEIMYLYGRMLKIRAYKGFNKKNIPIVNDSALFIGQTLRDKAICKDGKYLTILDFKEQVDSIIKNYKKVYYSRHPYVKKGDDDIMRFLIEKNIEIISIPAYDLLASGKIKKCFSISSSVVHEAKYMGVECEFLYKPIFKFGTKFPNEYISIYQSFVSPKFWELILKPVMDVNICEDIKFIEGKDKLRDMLNFYWNYSSIDKLELLRNSIQKQPMLERKSMPEKKIIVNKISKSMYEDACKKIKKYDVISFDIFDTLVQRDIATPNDIFNIMEKEIGVKNFAQTRQASRKLVKNSSMKEEILLHERYEAMSKELGIDVTQYANLELEYENIFIKERALGKKLYLFAKKLGKKIIYTSDMYLSRDSIIEILQKNNYDITNDLYLSSDVDKTKLKGSLYDYIIAKGISNKSILHIGDSIKSDVESAKNKGIDSYHLISSHDIFSENSNLFKLFKKNNNILYSITCGLIQNRFFDDTSINKNTFCGSSIYNIGYSLIGIMMFSFAKFIIEDAINKGFKRIYFLSRDGDIVKKCYDVIKKFYDNAPESFYLRSSRRAFNIAAIHNSNDIENILNVNFSQETVKEFYMNRFGVEIDNNIIKKYGIFSSNTDIISFKKDKERLFKFTHMIQDLILHNAAEERSCLLEYLTSMNLFNKDSIALVDIGHHGTMQKSLENLIGKDIYGYYFVTFSEAQNNIRNYSSFYYHNIDSKDITNNYRKFILMFESVFLNNEDSLIRFERNKNTIIPVFLNIKDSNRKKFITSLHHGCIDFVNDLSTLIKEKMHLIDISPELSCLPYVEFLNNPQYADAKLFYGIEFENVYSGRNIRYLVNDKNSIWKEAENVIHHSKNNLFYNFINYCIFYCCSTKKYNKFLKNPREFFSDSRFALVRNLSKFF